MTDKRRPTGPAYWLISLGVVVAVAAQVAATALGQLTGTPALPTADLALDIAVGVAGCALMPFVVRLRTVPMFLAAALAAVTPTGTPAAAVTVLSAGRWKSFRLALGVALISFTAHLLRWIWFPIDALSFGWWVVLDIAVNAALLGWGANGRWRAEVLESYRDRAHRAEAESARRVEQARDLERARITREIHDVLGHRLSLVATYAGALEFRPDASPEQVARAASVVRAGLHQALEELREVIRIAKDDSAEWGPQPTLADIDRLIDESRQAGTSVQSHIDVASEAPPSLGRTAYRVVQEALTNARKHAPGQPVRVVIEGDETGGLNIAVSNPLPVSREVNAGPGGASGHGFGLIGLGERVAIAGGRIRHDVDAHRDFTLRAWIPWPGEHNVTSTDRR